MRKSINYETATDEELYDFFRAPPKDDDRWPKVGDKVKFLTAEGRFYPHFTNVIANAKDKLHIGGIYIVKKCEVYSSWCAVWLDELGENKFCHLDMFEYPVKD
jgi:hypothetical protein